MSDVYTDAEIKEKLSDLKGWKLEKGAISRTFEFDNFADAIEFVNAVAEAAEDAQHHPDMDIRYSKVKLALVSHDAGGITDLDFDLAIQVSQFV